MSAPLAGAVAAAPQGKAERHTQRELTRTNSSHIPALDGVRGLAIALVFLRHMSLLTWLRGSASAVDRTVATVAGTGWIGVDLFFVLSGFLITGILLDANDRPGPVMAKMTRFYSRRVLRIFPLYYTACAILFFVVPLLPYFRAQPEIAALHRSEPWYWAYAVNVLEVLRGGAATPFNSGHFWSLAVEEQFYIVWPFVVLGTSRQTLRRIVVGLILAGPLIRLLCLALLPRAAGEAAAYTLSFARVDVLGVGALLALLYRGDRATWGRIARWCRVLGGGALAGFVLLVAVRGSGSTGLVMQTLGYSAVALGMGSLIACTLDAARGSGALERLFRRRTLRTLGKYSYCLYVVHYPLMTVLDLVWVHMHIPTVGGSSLPSWVIYGGALAGASFAIAWVSWRVLEAPMLAMKDRITFGAVAARQRG